MSKKQNNLPKSNSLENITNEISRKTTLSINLNVIQSKSGLNYYITQSPDPNNLHNYKDLLLKNNINVLIKLCEENKYDADYLEHNGITVINIPLRDGTVPNKNVIKIWTDIVKQEIKKKNKSIAIHCMSGLGRAPLFVCVCLIIIDKMDPIEAITKVRSQIKLALNTNQIRFLESLNYSNESKKGCIIC